MRCFQDRQSSPRKLERLVCTSVSGHRHDYEMIPRIAALAWLGPFGGGGALGGSSKLTVQWVVLL